ncbi:MAG: hypothetical protein CMO26_20685 [Thiotrichales bacterium]|nr:hypothetical protein [Thiotrichales bacterium]
MQTSIRSADRQVVQSGRHALHRHTAESTSNPECRRGVCVATSAEPLSTGLPRSTLTNTAIIPHDSHTSPQIGQRMVDIFAENLKRHVSEAPSMNVCDVQRGY